MMGDGKQSAGNYGETDSKECIGDKSYIKDL
jgi:hypothetical protein